MSNKSRGLKKKLLAGLCAFASGVGGANAAEHFLNANEVTLSGFGYKKVNCDINGLKKFRSIVFENTGKPLDDFGILGFANANDTYDIYVTMGKTTTFGNEMVTFDLWNRKADSGEATFNCVVTLAVPAEYVVAKLGLDNDINIPENKWKNFLDLQLPNASGGKCTAKCALLRILFNDILGFGFSFYDDAAGEYVLGGNNFVVPTQTSHPGLLDCLRCVSYQLHNNGWALGSDNGNITYAANKDAEMAVNDASVWSRLTANVKTRKNDQGQVVGSDYYQAYHVEPGKTPGGGGQPQSQMTKGQKAGMGILGTLAAAGIIHAGLQYGVFDPARKAENNLKDAELASLRRERQGFKEKEKILGNYRKIAKSKGIYRDLIRRAEGNAGTNAKDSNGHGRRFRRGRR